MSSGLAPDNSDSSIGFNDVNHMYLLSLVKGYSSASTSVPARYYLAESTGVEAEDICEELLQNQCYVA